MQSVNEVRTLYLDMVQRCIINTIYEDPNQGFWSPKVFDSQSRELGRDWPMKAHSMIGNRRLGNLREVTEFVIANQIPGDFIETGVWRGGACIMARAVFKAYGVTDRRVWVADSFCGLPAPNQKFAADANDKHHTYPQLAISLEEVKSNFAKYDLLDDQVVFLKGWFSETLPRAPIKALAVLRLDGDMYESTMDGLTQLYSKVSPGGVIIVDDYGAVAACQQAVLEFRAKHKIEDPIYNIDGIGVFWQKSAAVASDVPESTSAKASAQSV